ncbi:translation initiation factor eIF-2B subunit gamma [[Candida] anglica]|uniref:Translation initiation factor eIF2B subunit gamma n=1 Tax=[Candida] anglica TaxID=148631 RepID=A0ABP0EP03_9ASCO
MEFHAVILCGPGKALTPFSSIRSTGTPKALLPIANRPMIEYVLEWCDRAFFPQVTVVCDDDSKDAISGALEQYKKKREQQQAALIAEEEGSHGAVPGSVGASNNASSGAVANDTPSNISVVTLTTEHSGEILHHLYKTSTLKKFQNFVLLPCDFVTDLPPQVLIEAYRNKSESDLGLLVHYRNQFDNIEDKKSKIFKKNYTIYTDVDDGQTRLLDIMSSEDVDFHKALQLRTQMCWRHANSTVATKLLNSCIFFGSGELIFPIFENPQEKFTDSYFRHRSATKVIRDLAKRSWKHSEPRENVGFLILPQQATFFRINNTPVFMEANRYFMKLQASSRAQQQHAATTAAQSSGQQPPKDKNSANVGADSLVGHATTLDEKTTVKRTVVGTDCKIGKRVKLTGCVILNNVTIEDDVHLENCIVGNNVIIHSKARLTACNIESTLEVAKGTQAKGESLLCLSLEGLVAGGDEGDNFAVGSESDSDDYDSEEDDSESGSGSEGELDEYGDNSDGLFAY